MEWAMLDWKDWTSWNGLRGSMQGKPSRHRRRVTPWQRKYSYREPLLRYVPLE
jgi:hypothetical protein